MLLHRLWRLLVQDKTLTLVEQKRFPPTAAHYNTKAHLAHPWRHRNTSIPAPPASCQSTVPESTRYLNRRQPLVRAQLLHTQAPGSVHQGVPRVRDVPVGTGEVHPGGLEWMPATKRYLQVVDKAFPARSLPAWDGQRPYEDAAVLGLHIAALREYTAVQQYDVVSTCKQQG